MRRLYILDPSRVKVRGGVKDLTEFAQAAWQNRVLFFDNLTSVPNWFSDALCRAITGEGWSKRTLFTNEDSTIFEYKGIIGLAGINLVSDRPDLLDRSLIIPLEPIAIGRRREERSFWMEFKEAMPGIFGGLLNCLATAISLKPRIKINSLPRMADFAYWGAAAAEALGRNKEDFLEAYMRNVGRQNDAAIEANPVAQAVLAFMEERENWVGNPGDLLEKLDEAAEDHHIDVKSRMWPKNHVWLTRRLREVQPNLLAMGVEFTNDREGRTRTLCLRKAPGNTVTPVITVTAIEKQEVTNDGKVTVKPKLKNTVTSELFVNKGDDSNDTNDSISGHLTGTQELPSDVAEVKSFQTEVDH